MLSASRLRRGFGGQAQFILPARFIRAALCAARTEFRSSYFKNTPPRDFVIKSDASAERLMLNILKFYEQSGTKL